MADPTGARWFKSSRSGNGGDCVEVATNLIEREAAIFVRDSKNPEGGTLTFEPDAWQEFIAGVRSSEFDR